MEWKIIIAEIGITALGITHLAIQGDGEVLQQCILALGILGGVQATLFYAKANTATPTETPAEKVV